MDNNNYSKYEVIDDKSKYEAQEDVSAFITKVLGYMALALVASGVAAYLFGTSEDLLRLLYTIDYEQGTIGRSGLGWIVMLAPLGFVIFISARLQKMSRQTLTITFFAFAIIFGISISSIFIQYSMGFIAETFLITSGTFGAMALVGYTTSVDLSKMGSILYMALIGLIIAMVVNWFAESAMASYIISGLGVLIFTGLTAYDMQKIKHMAMTIGNDPEARHKGIVMGALNLYLDFVNLFLFMLRFMGRD